VSQIYNIIGKFATKYSNHKLCGPDASDGYYMTNLVIYASHPLRLAYIHDKNCGRLDT